MKILLALVFVAAAANCFAEEKPEGPCKEIKDACEKAGFVKNEAKDCLIPGSQKKGRASARLFHQGRFLSRLRFPAVTTSL